MRNPTYLGGQQWKLGDEFLPFHPQASHISPDYRDGWNRCFWMAVGSSAATPLVKDCSTCEYGDLHASKTPCRTCTVLWKPENGGVSDNWIQEPRWTRTTPRT